MSELHPAIRKIAKAGTIGKPASKQVWEASFSKPDLHLVTNMVWGYKKVYGIDNMPVLTKSDPTKLSHLALIYPADVWEVFLEQPWDKVGARLQKRKIPLNTAEVKEGGFLVVIWPLAEAIKLAKVWADTDAAGATCMFMDPEHGVICGTVQKF